MKKKLLFLLLICTFAFVLAISAYAADVEPTIVLDNGTALTPVDNSFYLPSGTDITRLKFNFGSSYTSITFEDKPVTDGSVIDISNCAQTDKISGTMKYYKVRFKTEDTSIPYHTLYIYYANTLPAVFIDTSIGADLMIGENITDSSAGVMMTDADGTILVNLQGNEVRTRGNTTPTMLKKPFQIKFEQKMDIFGMGKAKTWVLLANYLDQSYIRNSVMYKLAKDMGMGACDFKNVDVYVDGEYQGVYLLCEKVNINKNRVNITELENLNDALNTDYSSTTVITSGDLIDSTVLTEYKYVNNMVNPDDITGGYLIELDNNNKENRDEFGSYFMTSTAYGENLYVIKSPEYCSKEQVEYIAKIFAEIEEAMASSNGKNSLGKHYTEYVDLESYAVAYIMAEYGKNYDAGSASIYFNKDIDRNGEFSKVVKGPLWDCDNTLGNIHRNGANDQEAMWASNRTPWNMLTRHSDFNTLVKEKFEQAYDIIYDMLNWGGFIDQQVADLGNSAHMDRLRWETYSDSTWPLYADGSMHWWERYGENNFPAYRYYCDDVNNTTDTAIGYLCVAMQTRAEYLADTWGCEMTRRTRVLSTDVPEPDPEPDPDDSYDDSQSESSTSLDTESKEQTSSSSSSASTEQESSSSSSSSSEQQSSSSADPPDDEDDEELNFFEKIIKAISDFFKNLFDGLFKADAEG